MSTNIGWTDETWNPMVNCKKISSGCKFCYAETMAKRLKAMGIDAYRHGFNKPTMNPWKLEQPLYWRKPRRVFVNSMTDWALVDWPLTYIKAMFSIMNQTPQHQYQLLTKRSANLLTLSPKLTWTDNIWAGVSVENVTYTYRIDDLRKAQIPHRFLSLEPLLGPLPNLDLSGIDWVIVGGESGPKARPMKKEWVTDIRDQCLKQKIPFFFKQWGGTHAKKGGKELQGREWCEMPAFNQGVQV